MGVRSLLAWFFVGFWGLFAFVGGILAFLAGGLIWDRQRRIFHGLARWWATTVIRLHFWTVRVELRGEDHARGGPFVVVPNHQSMVDLLALYLLPLSYRTVVKRTWSRTPLGLNMWLAGYVFTPRERSPEARARLFARCAAWMERGHGVLIFPEGTRAKGWALGPFRAGAFQLSAQTGRPLLPVAIAGTNDVSHPTSWRFSFARRGVIVEILPPIHPGDQRPRELARACREVIEARVRALRSELYATYGQGPAPGETDADSEGASVGGG